VNTDHRLESVKDLSLSLGQYRKEESGQLQTESLRVCKRKSQPSHRKSKKCWLGVL